MLNPAPHNIIGVGSRYVLSLFVVRLVICHVSLGLGKQPFYDEISVISHQHSPLPYVL